MDETERLRRDIQDFMATKGVATNRKGTKRKIQGYDKSQEDFAAMMAKPAGKPSKTRKRNGREHQTVQDRWKNHQRLRDEIATERLPELRQNHPKMDEAEIVKLAKSCASADLNQNPNTRSPFADTLNYRIKGAFTDWNIEQASKDLTIFGTLKLNRRNGETLNEDEADKIVSRFFAKIDRVYYPSRAVKTGTRVKRLTYRHQGIWENGHYQFLAKAPNDDPETFIAIVKNLWAIASPFANIGDSWVQERYSPEGSAAYLAHESHSLGADTLKLNLSHLQDPQGNPEDYQTLDQARRIIKAKIGYYTNRTDRLNELKTTGQHQTQASVGLAERTIKREARLLLAKTQLHP
ncbi:MAG: hypothetical protein HWD91_06020 [Marivivens sp.]|uniref:hypothetical protein n=1 Tax=Marivivens sp. TaxID=1978374 RepID=UPI0017AA7E94|nr:hypothetical protein [Marivivens sp.]NVJ95125.1 hypothetical protein [Marivivens sp.]